MLYSWLPANPYAFIFLSVSFYHRQHFLLQFLYFFQCTFQPFSLLFFSAAENRTNPTVLFSICFIVSLAVAMIIVRGSFLWSFLRRKANLMRNVAFPMSRSVGTNFIKLLLSARGFQTLDFLLPCLKFVSVLTHDLIIRSYIQELALRIYLNQTIFSLK